MSSQDIHECSVPDIDTVEKRSLYRRLKFRQALQKNLRNRFRSEYLGLLVQKPKKGIIRPIKVGQVVLVRKDNCKRIEWPLGKVIDIRSEKDKEVRLVRIKTSHSALLQLFKEFIF
ncbi:integrase catalytic domain-containing protein [Nephila pilipes]|uniref:Integrase catalytic domain-containing protein n=1 Tax=Nephila pilipes TaxID=299642 RepID=A0A8X6TCL5_NEPPI|nr:integrase catalytic domain-containing protein [Nephila pilipes]